MLYVLYGETVYGKSTLCCMYFTGKRYMINQHYVYVLYGESVHGNSTLYCRSFTGKGYMENQHYIMLYVWKLNIIYIAFTGKKYTLKTTLCWMSFNGKQYMDNQHYVACPLRENGTWTINTML